MKRKVHKRIIKDIVGGSSFGGYVASVCGLDALTHNLKFGKPTCLNCLRKLRKGREK